ncbi:DUF7533 family protein [Halorarius litoreus]|uniref:DUF7533 family protein n=1 Tax=Halorarius litoreus TaxID=2962676 RepID=UPI0020CD1137|nr:hypothetical protein [Halorarius litoreus]
MARSIMGTIGLAATLALAIPIALFGLDLFLRGDRLLGGAALGIAVLMVLIEEYLTTPMDIPGKVAGATIGKVVKEPEERDEE